MIRLQFFFEKNIPKLTSWVIDATLNLNQESVIFTGKFVFESPNITNNFYFLYKTYIFH